MFPGQRSRTLSVPHRSLCVAEGRDRCHDLGSQIKVFQKHWPKTCQSLKRHGQPSFLQKQVSKSELEKGTCCVTWKNVVLLNLIGLINGLWRDQEILSSMKIDECLLESPPADTELPLFSVMVITLTNEDLKLMQGPRMLNTDRCQDKCKEKKKRMPSPSLP